MPSIKNLSEPVQAAVALVKKHTTGKDAELAGGIVPRWLFAAIPAWGVRSSKMDTILLLLMVEILDAYRPRAEGVYFRDFAYQINRTDLAKRFVCKQRDISRALTFLEKRGWLRRTHRANVQGDGEYAGKAAFVIPIVEKIVQRIGEVRCRSAARGTPFSGTSAGSSEEPNPSVNGTSPTAEKHFSRNSANGAAKAAEDGGGAAEAAGARCRPATSESGSSGSDGPPSSSAAFDAPEARQNANKQPTYSSDGLGGGEASKLRDPKPTSSFKGSEKENSTHEVPAKDGLSAQAKADQFIGLYTEAIQRAGHIRLYQPSKADRIAVTKFFTLDPKCVLTLPLYLAILAWYFAENGRDSKSGRSYFACRKAFSLSGLFRFFSGIYGELIPEGVNNSSAYEVYQEFRTLFLDSELEALGLGQFVLNNIGRSGSNRAFWETQKPTQFGEYYKQRNRPVPEITPC